MNKNKKIYEIAIDLNISHSDIIEFLDGIGKTGYSIMSEVDTSTYSKILSKYSRERKKQEVYVKEKARNTIQSNRVTDEKMVDSLSASPQNAKSLSEKNAPKKASIGLKIIERPSNKKETEKDKHKEASVKTPDVEQKQKTIPKNRDTGNFKKVNIAAIADKINQSKNTPSSGKNLQKQSLKISAKTSKKKKKKNKIEKDTMDQNLDSNLLKLPEFSTLEELASSMNVKVQEVIMKSMELGMMTTINQRLDMDSMIMIADEFGFEINEAEIGELLEEETDVDDDKDEDKVERAPVVTVMGHVDHGKTSLLDSIRKENVVAGESGGITQHIGAYKVEIKNGKTITFLDTPGHEAFTAMRARGSKLTDIVIIVIAADDDVMPQTIEAIDHAKAASVPIIIAINKIDKPNANADKIFKKLSEYKILVEDWGGKYQSQLISAKTGQGIDDLLEKVIIESEILDLKASDTAQGSCIVVESKLDKGLGPIATALVQKGSLKKGQIFACGTQSSKIRLLLDERGNEVEVAKPSDPIQILGFENVPNAGEILKIYKDEKEARKISVKRSQLKREAEHQRFKKTTLDQIGKEISEGRVKDLNLLIKGDVDGSIEALSDALMSISTDEVNVKIIHRSVGMINENDIALAKASDAIIITFNLSISKQIRIKAKENGVDIRSYSIIYEAINEIKLALEGLLEPDKVEEALGIAEVRDKFKIPKIGIIAGCLITQGKVVRNAFLRVKREDSIIHEGKLTSLKRFKDDVKEVGESYECGIGVEGFSDFKTQDIIEVFEIKEVKRTL